MTYGFRLFLVVLLVICAPAAPAAAGEPWGEWLVAEKSAQIRILDCAGALWGVIAWEKDPGGADEKNPDLGKRGRPTLGMPILLGMKPIAPGKWDGKIYNSENGKTYSGGIRMIDDGSLRIFGCILGFLCGGETWTRSEAPSSNNLPETGAATCARLDAS